MATKTRIGARRRGSQQAEKDPNPSPMEDFDLFDCGRIEPVARSSVPVRRRTFSNEGRSARPGGPGR